MNPLIIRADTTTETGAGHIMRCLALAQAWQDQGGKAAFISRCDSEALRSRITEEGFEYIPLKQTHPDPLDLDLTVRTRNRLKEPNSTFNTWLVVDGYHFDAGYQKSVKAAGYKLLWIDDYGHADHYYADLILNQNVSADPGLYANREPYTQLLMGPRYVLLRHEFRHQPGRPHQNPVTARKVLLTLGGADPGNFTLKAIQALRQVGIAGLEARIIIGPANPHRQSLEKGLGGDSRLHLLTNVDEMAELMAWADVAISAGGTTCFELAFMGVPFLILVISENQRANAEALDRQGIAINLGWPQDLSEASLASQLEQLMANAGRRSLMSQRGQDLIDGQGGERLCQGLN